MYPQNPEQISTHPLPLDGAIARGVAIWDGVSAEELDVLVVRAHESFAEQKLDKSKEYGSCIAFAIKMRPVDESAVDIALIATAVKENEGTTTTHAYKDVVAEEGKLNDLWTGEDANRQIHLRKFVGNVVMTDGSQRQGIVYTLCSAVKPEEKNGDKK